MKKFLILSGLIVFALVGCNHKQNSDNGAKKIEEQIIGTWLKFGPQGIFTIEFRDNGLVETDMGNDGTIDVISEYEIVGDTISFSIFQFIFCHFLAENELKDTSAKFLNYFKSMRKIKNCSDLYLMKNLEILPIF